MSSDEERSIRKQRIVLARRVRAFGWGGLGIILLLGVYALLSSEQSANSRGNFPPLNEVWTEFLGNSPYYVSNAGWTALAAFLGLLLGASFGLLMGLVAGISNRAYLLLTPLAVWLKATPIIALSPFFALFLVGKETGLAAVSAAAICFFPVYVNVSFGLRGKSSPELEYVLSLRPSNVEVLKLIQFPRAIGYAIAGLRTASTLAVVGATVGEFMGASQGVGILVINAQHQSAVSKLLVAILIAGLIGVSFYVATAAVGHVVTKRYFPSVASDLGSA